MLMRNEIPKLGQRSASSSKSVRLENNALALRIVEVWLCLGGFSLVLFPALRGSSEWIGSLPFWLVVVPLFNYGVLRWRQVWTVSRAVIVTMTARRKRVAPAARRSRKAHAVSRNRIVAAAALPLITR